MLKSRHLSSRMAKNSCEDFRYVHMLYIACDEKSSYLQKIFLIASRDWIKSRKGKSDKN